VHVGAVVMTTMLTVPVAAGIALRGRGLCLSVVVMAVAATAPVRLRLRLVRAVFAGLVRGLAVPISTISAMLVSIMVRMPLSGFAVMVHTLWTESLRRSYNVDRW
jgi:hypothetical protein